MAVQNLESGRLLTSYRLPRELKSKLQASGFMTSADLNDISPLDLMSMLKIPNDEAVEILNAVRNSGAKISPRLVSEILDEDESHGKIVTFSECIDKMLGGGVPFGKITELCGAPGTGKTQFCFQLAVDVQLPESLGGVNGEAVYIDTEGSFVVERLAEIASSTVSHCQRITDGSDEQRQAAENFNLSEILSRIHCYSCRSYGELIAVIHLLPDFIALHPQVKVVLVDSIAFPFRHDITDLSLRTRLLNNLSQNLHSLAALHKLAIVLTNQMTTKFDDANFGQSRLVPALGESWGHCSTIRVVLHRQDALRHAHLYKSPSNKEATVPFQITVAGIRDAINDAGSKVTHSEDQPSAKRRKFDSHV